MNVSTRRMHACPLNQLPRRPPLPPPSSRNSPCDQVIKTPARPEAANEAFPAHGKPAKPSFQSACVQKHSPYNRKPQVFAAVSLVPSGACTSLGDIRLSFGCSKK